MFKDYNNYLKTSLKVYIFVLFIVFILKIVGLDYFRIDINNPIIVKVNNLCLNYHLIDIWYCITLFIYTYIIVSISTNEINSYKIVLLFMPLIIISKIICKNYPFISLVLDFVILTIICLIKKGNLKRLYLIAFLNIIYQVLSLFIRGKSIIIDQNDFIQAMIFNLDYILLMLITYKYYFISRKGGSSKWEDGEVYLFSLKKLNLKKSLQKLQKNYQNNLKKFKKKSKVEKLTIIIYIILSLIWNSLSVLLILFIAKINNTFVECIFILTSFWLSKGKFGKAFHFDSMMICFIVSNLTYYSLNRITTSLGISMLIPILLGVGLSYFTSKFVKKSYKPLYRGMPIDQFEDTITRVVDKDSIKYKICKEFYLDKVSELSLSFKYNYSVPGIRKIKERINEKIKAL